MEAIYYILIVVFGVISAFIAFRVTVIVKSLNANRKEYNKRKDGHCTGAHKYIKIDISLQQKDLLFCTDCGFSPELDNYISVPYIQNIKMMRDQEAKYEEWKLGKVCDLARKHNITFDAAQDIVNTALSFKKDYTVSFIEEMMKKPLQLK